MSVVLSPEYRAFDIFFEQFTFVDSRLNLIKAGCKENDIAG